jgi:hypothetical protein
MLIFILKEALPAVVVVVVAIGGRAVFFKRNKEGTENISSVARRRKRTYFLNTLII